MWRAQKPAQTFFWPAGATSAGSAGWTVGITAASLGGHSVTG